MDGHLMMSLKERERMKVLSRVAAGELRLVDAVGIMGTSYRQGQRLKARYVAEGDAGIVHRSRGRPSNRGGGAEGKRKAVIERYRESYEDFGPTLAAEKLAAEGHEMDHETLRRWLMAEGLWTRKRKRELHRSWRERKKHFGELVQMDGSHHGWFEDRGGKCCLMNMVDDARGERLCQFSEEETTLAALGLLLAWIQKYGIPKALYTDKKNIFVPEERIRREAREEGREVFTQFGRVCHELGIRIIAANSPQAKGRIERSHSVYQDRLVKEMRLEGVSTIEDGNRLLENGFVDLLNRKFAVEAAEKADYHRSAEGYDLEAIFCIEEERTVTADWIVRFENRFFQLTTPQKEMRGKGKVKIQRRLAGSLHFYFKGQYLEWKELPERPEPQNRSKKKKRPSAAITEKYIPPPNHLWRRMRIGKEPPLQRL